jgi:hypothetical protein
MPKEIPINGPHEFEKENLLTLEDSNGSYDKVKCSKCGLEGKRRSISTVEVDGRKSGDQIKNCDGVIPEKIKVTSDYPATAGDQFRNLKKGTKHNVVDPPEGYKNDGSGVWVMGEGEPVKILSHEFRPIE